MTFIINQKKFLLRALFLYHPSFPSVKIEEPDAQAIAEFIWHGDGYIIPHQGTKTSITRKIDLAPGTRPG